MYSEVRAKKGRGMDRSWKDFEELVAHIERVLAPSGAVVKANDWIRNKLTGRKRQVDASIRYNIGTVPILITVECRKRKHKQDDTWIEQLVTKRQNLGAATTIAVASEDISEQAKKTAKFYGIEFRKISDISKEDIIDWLHIGEIRHVLFKPVITGVKIFMYPQLGELNVLLHHSVIEAAGKDLVNARVFVRSSDLEPLGIDNILDSAIAAGLDIFSNIPFSEGIISRRVVINFEKGAIHILSDKGTRDIRRIAVDVDIQVIIEVSPIDDMGFVCTDYDRVSVFGIESYTEFGGQPLTVSIIKQEGVDVVHISVTKKKRNRIADDQNENAV